jgi:hypothetical protein
MIHLNYSRPLPPSPASNLPLFLSLPVCRPSSLLRGEGGWWAWSRIKPSINHSILSIQSVSLIYQPCLKGTLRRIKDLQCRIGFVVFLARRQASRLETWPKNIGIYKVSHIYEEFLLTDMSRPEIEPRTPAMQACTLPKKKSQLARCQFGYSEPLHRCPTDLPSCLSFFIADLNSFIFLYLAQSTSHTGMSHSSNRQSSSGTPRPPT